MVGFPLRESSNPELKSRLEEAQRRFRPARLWFVGPELPDFLEKLCLEREEDKYFRLDLKAPGGLNGPHQANCSGWLPKHGKGSLWNAGTSLTHPTGNSPKS